MKYAVFATCILAYTTQALNLAEQDQPADIMEAEENFLGETWTDAEASAQPWYERLFEGKETTATRALQKLSAVRQQIGTMMRDSVTSADCST